MERASEAHTPFWHTLANSEVLRVLESATRGLDRAEAARRMVRHGLNELQAAQRISPWALLAEQFKNVLIVIMLVATGLSFFLGHGVEAIAIGVIVFFAVGLGFVQEYRSERAIEALRKTRAAMEKAYGKCADGYSEMSVPDGKGSLARTEGRRDDLAGKKTAPGGPGLSFKLESDSH